MTGSTGPTAPGDIAFGSLGTRTHTAIRPSGGWFVSNAGWVVGDKATLVVDTFASERRTRELMTAIDATRAAAGAADTDKLLVLTHAHGDHANGAGLLESAGATVWGAAFTGEELTTNGIQRFPGLLAEPDWGAVSTPATFRPLAGTQSFDLGGVVAEVTTLARAAHSGGDSFVHLPGEGALFAGDLVWNRVTPLALNGSVTGWLDQLDSIALLHPGTVVSGHGVPAGPDIIDDTRRYLDWVVELAHEVIAGTTFTADALRDRRATQLWSDWGCPERDLANVPRAVSDLTGAPYDAMAAMVAMRDQWNGLIHVDA